MVDRLLEVPEPRCSSSTPRERFARVQPGIVLDRLRDAAEEHELTFGPDPATHSRCTLGGMIGNNSCGTHSIMAGVTADNIESLDVLLYDGTRLTLPKPGGGGRARARRSPPAGARARSTRALRDLRDRYADDDPRAAFPTSRDGSRATTSTGCCPRTASISPRQWSAPSRPARSCSRRAASSSTARNIARSSCSATTDPPTSADQVPEIMEFGPIALETFDRRAASINELGQGLQAPPRAAARAATPGCWSSSAPTASEEADEQAERMLAQPAQARRSARRRQALRGSEPRSPQVWEIREGGVGN